MTETNPTAENRGMALNRKYLSCHVTVLPPCDDDERIKRLIAYHSTLLIKDTKYRKLKNVARFIVQKVPEDSPLLDQYSFKIALAFRKRFKNCTMLVSDERYLDTGVQQFTGRLPPYFLKDILPHGFEFNTFKDGKLFTVQPMESQQRVIVAIRHYVRKGYSYKQVVSVFNTGYNREGIPRPAYIFKHQSGTPWTPRHIENIGHLLAYLKNHL